MNRWFKEKLKELAGPEFEFEERLAVNVKPPPPGFANLVSMLYWESLESEVKGGQNVLNRNY